MKRNQFISILTVAFVVMGTVVSLVCVSPTPAAAYESHVAVIITGDIELASSDLVSAGTGTASDPYIIEGYSFEGGASGLCIIDTTKHLVIRGVYASGNDIGIKLDNVTNVVIEDSVSTFNYSGNTYQGMYIEDSSLVAVDNCSVIYNSVGIYFKSSSGCSVSNNSLYMNNVGIYISGCDDFVILSNDVNNSADDDILLEHSSSVIVSDNYLHYDPSFGCSMRGVSVHQSQDVEVRDNTAAIFVSGLHLLESSNLTISGNTLDNGTMFGFEMYSCTDVSMTANILTNFTGRGLAAEDSSRCEVRDNWFSSWSDLGFQSAMLDSCSEFSISGNALHGGGRGIELWGSEIEHFASHTIDDENLWHGLPVIYYHDADMLMVSNVTASQVILANCSNSVVEGLQYPCAAVDLFFLSNSTLTGCILNSSTAECIRILHSSELLVYNNLIYVEGGAVYLMSCTDVYVESNTINGGFVDLFVQTSDGILIYGNELSGISQYGRTGIGIYTYESRDVVIACNLVQSCSPGIWLNQLSENVTVFGNAVLSCGIGLELAGASDVLVTENEIAFCDYTGMWSYGSSGVFTYHNNFLDNAVHASEESGTGNYWDDGYPDGGNYWSGYAGGDRNHGADQDIPGADGIGDTEYLGEGFVDHYPFTYPCGVDAPPVAIFEVTPGTGTTETVFEFDASLSGDREDPYETIEVRWDFDGDDSWDTDWSTERVAYHEYSISDTYTTRLEVRDSSGLTSQSDGTIDIEPGPDDTEAPITSAILSGTVIVDGWYVSPVTTVLAAEDPNGVSWTRYSVDEGDWTTYELPVEISSDGIHALQFYSCDSYGNEELVRTVEVRIDTTAPVLLAPLAENTVYDSADVNISWTCSDNCSGVASVEYSLDNGGQIVCQTDGYVELANLSEGTHWLTIVAHDEAGNNVTLEIEFQVDTNEGSWTESYWLAVGAATIAVAALAVTAIIIRKRQGKEPEG